VNYLVKILILIVERYCGLQMDKCALLIVEYRWIVVDYGLWNTNG